MAANVCTHLRIPLPLRPMPRVIHNEGDGLACPTCLAFITPSPTDTLGQAAATTRSATA